MSQIKFHISLCLSKFSKNIPTNKIEEYVQIKIKEIDTLEKKIVILKEEEQEITQRIDIGKELYDDLCNQEERTISKLNEFSDFKDKLEEIKISMEKVPKYIKILRKIKRKGYDLEEVLSDLSDYEFTKQKYNLLYDNTLIFENDLKKIKSNIK